MPDLINGEFYWVTPFDHYEPMVARYQSGGRSFVFPGQAVARPHRDYAVIAAIGRPAPMKIDPAANEYMRPVILPGELYAVRNAVALGEFYGFGNLISHLKRAWAIKLMGSNPGLTYAAALETTDVDGYPLQFEDSNLFEPPPPAG